MGGKIKEGKVNLIKKKKAEKVKREKNKVNSMMAPSFSFSLVPRRKKIKLIPDI